jgi:hypothetical protein
MFPNQLLEPTAVRIAREFREAVNAQLDAQMYEMGQRWLQVEYALEDKIDALIIEIQDMVKDGKEPSKAMITRLQRYQELRNQAHDEILRYENYIDGAIKTGQYNMAVEGLYVGKETIFALYQDAGMLGSFNILNANAIETMVGYLGNGAPLNSLLQEAFPYAWKGMTDKLVEGIALGLSPRETANKMYKGMSHGFNRLLTISRTEQLRAYRQATVMQYRESGVVKGFRRLVAKQGACMACLVSDGEYFEVAEDFSDHPNGRCSLICVLNGVPEREWLYGENWFRSLGADQQQSIMGGQYYQAWKGGAFKLSELRSTAHSDVWGDSPKVTPLKELLGVD